MQLLSIQNVAAATELNFNFDLTLMDLNSNSYSSCGKQQSDLLRFVVWAGGGWEQGKQLGLWHWVQVTQTRVEARRWTEGVGLQVCSGLVAGLDVGAVPATGWTVDC